MPAELELPPEDNFAIKPRYPAGACLSVCLSVYLLLLAGCWEPTGYTRSRVVIPPTGVPAHLLSGGFEGLCVLWPGQCHSQRGCAEDSPGGPGGQGSGDRYSHPAAQRQEAGAPPLHFPCRGQGAHAGALAPAWGHVWGLGGPCAGLSHPLRGRSLSGCPAWPERPGSVAERQAEAGLHPTVGAVVGAGEEAREQGSGAVQSSDMSDRRGRKSPKETRNQMLSSSSRFGTRGRRGSKAPKTQRSVCGRSTALTRCPGQPAHAAPAAHLDAALR